VKIDVMGFFRWQV